MTVHAKAAQEIYARSSRGRVTAMFLVLVRGMGANFPRPRSCSRNSAPAKGTGYSRNLVLRIGICARGHDRYIFDLSLFAPGRRSDFAFGHRQVALDFGSLEIPCLHT